MIRLADCCPVIRAFLGVIAIATLTTVGTAIEARADEEPAPVGHEHVMVSADEVAFYSNQAMLEARGGVRVQLADGTSLTGDAFSMDLRLQRFLVIGHVQLHTSAGDYAGAGFADFLPFRRMYFIPIDPADRWTFLNGDFSHPEKGRVMPGDAFALPDLSAAHPYVIAQSADIDPATGIRFSSAQFVFFNHALTTPPVGPYVTNFSDNHYFGENSLAGAEFDAPYSFAGGPHALSTLHYRYDSVRHSYVSFEQHLVYDKGYAVFSVNPMMQPSKQWNAFAYDRVSPHAALSLAGQLFTVQEGLSEPTSADGFVDVQFAQALPHSGIRIDLTQSYYNLLSGAKSPNHPLVAGISWAGFDEPVLRTGLSYRLLSGLAHAHDVYGISATGTHDVWAEFLGGSVYTPVFRGPFKTAVNAILTEQRTWLSFPNILNTEVFQLSDSRRVTDKFYLVASYIVTSARTNTPALTIASPNMATGLVPQPASATGMPFVLQGNAAATDRSTQLTASFAPSADFQLSLTGQHNVYTPAASAGAFPDQLSGNMRVRISRTLFVNVQRSFNFSSHAFSPQFVFQVSSQ